MYLKPINPNKCTLMHKKIKTNMRSKKEKIQLKTIINIFI